MLIYFVNVPEDTVWDEDYLYALNWAIEQMFGTKCEFQTFYLKEVDSKIHALVTDAPEMTLERRRSLATKIFWFLWLHKRNSNADVAFVGYENDYTFNDADFPKNVGG